MTAPISVAALTAEQAMPARESYERDGFFLAPQVLPNELIARVAARIDAVVAGTYETGTPPISRSFAPGQGLDKLQKIDNTPFGSRHP